MRRVVSVLAVVVFLAVGAAPAAGADDEPYYMFHNRAANSTLCMSAEGGVMANGTKIIQWRCSTAARDQHWYLEGNMIKSRKNPSFCLSAPNNWESSGLQLIIWRCQSAPGQSWVAATKEGYPMIMNISSGKFVAVAGGSQTPGAPVIQWGWTRNPDQRWYPRLLADV